MTAYGEIAVAVNIMVGGSWRLGAGSRLRAAHYPEQEL